MAANTRLTQANILGQNQGLVAFLSHLETELKRSNVGFAAEIFSKLVPFTFLSVTSLCPGFFIFHHNFQTNGERQADGGASRGSHVLGHLEVASLAVPHRGPRRKPHLWEAGRATLSLLAPGVSAALDCPWGPVPFVRQELQQDWDFMV